MSVRLTIGDCREVLRTMADGSVDCVVTDPPYGETSLTWDRTVSGWANEVQRVLKPSGSMWVFGSIQFFMEMAKAGEFDGWSQAQDLVWEKHNGSNSFADRFRRVHEHAVQFYRSTWTGVYKQPLFTSDATARAVRRKTRPPQWGDISASTYLSEDGGPRLMRSVMFCRSEHGVAEHPTQKPVAVCLPLIEYSCPPGGTVLDPFAGAGTTGIAAKQLGRNAVLIEINPDYVATAERRIRLDAPLLAESEAGVLTAAS